MRKRKPQQILNHYSAWKYVVLVVTVAIMLLSAIPTWFGEDAAVQISAKGGPVPTPFAIKKELDDNHIAIKKIEQKPAHTIVILDEEDQQTKAKEVLAKLIKGENAEERLTLALEPAAPMWLQDMGFEPIKLGLDLRGGVQFLLDVDVNQVFKVQGQSLADDLRADFRKEGIRAARVEIMAADKLLVRLPSSDAKQ